VDPARVEDSAANEIVSRWSGLCQTKLRKPTQQIALEEDASSHEDGRLPELLK